MHVLLVEDNSEVGEVVTRALAKDGHRIRVAGSAGAAAVYLAEEVFDLLVLDLGLPDDDGLNLCRRLRAAGATLPILVLTARSTIPSRVAGLDAGADDFLGKPFAVAELRARVRALLRRGTVAQQAIVEIGEAKLNFAAKRAWAGSSEVPLTAREWSLIELLIARQGRVVSRLEILEGIWGTSSSAAAASLEVIVGRIRKKLGSGLVRTIRGEGYAIAS